MLDAHNGDCVHVDFSCLFDRGLTLERPELVPFRLTQNMLDGFGPAGPDGAFRRCCEITLQARGHSRKKSQFSRPRHYLQHSMVRPGAVTPGLSEVLFRSISTVAGIRRIAPVDAAPHWQVLRAHCNTIISVLETFVHDPVIDWTRREKSDEENPHARDALSTIEGERRAALI